MVSEPSFSRMVSFYPKNLWNARLAYATFLGGSDDDYGYAIAADQEGAAYVTGGTHSSGFPSTPEAFDITHNGGEDAFVVKLNALGSDLAYATFLGGTGMDGSRGIAFDQGGAAYVVGFTYSSDFPSTAGAFDTAFSGGHEGFAVKLGASGRDLTYATFLGGSDSGGTGIWVEQSDTAYIAGGVESPDLPTTLGAFDTTYNGMDDAFVVKLAISAPDDEPPAAIYDLSATPGNAAGTVSLSWTAPGDDGNTGTASTYVVRYNSAQITEANWASSTNMTGEPTPGPAGTAETMTVSGLTPGQTYYFAIRTEDEIPNLSGISNSPSAVAKESGSALEFVYLPLVVRSWPRPPETPALHAIQNPGGDGGYTVSWSTAERATSYVLQEAAQATAPTSGDFATVYNDTGTSHDVAGKGAGRYHYRVKARNSSGDSGWSNVEWVDVLWEAEDNDDAPTQANGPLVSGKMYRGYPNDKNDYFYLELSSQATVEVVVEDFAPTSSHGDLLLYGPAAGGKRGEQVAQFGVRGRSTMSLGPLTLRPGRYHVRIYTAGNRSTTEAYRLTVTY